MTTADQTNGVDQINQMREASLADQSMMTQHSDSIEQGQDALMNKTNDSVNMSLTEANIHHSAQQNHIVENSSNAADAKENSDDPAMEISHKTHSH